jgi:O-antigen/teichoic acid export membrane protein
MTSGSPEPPPSDSVARNTVLAFLVRIFSASFTAVLTLFLVRALGPKEYGVFALAMGVGSLALIPSDFGISQSTARFLAEHRWDRTAVAAVVSDALRLKLLVSGLTCLLLAALAGPIAAAYDTEALAWPIRILALSIFGQDMLLLYDQVMEADRRVAVYLRVATAESFVETVASIGLVLAGLGAAGAMAGRAGGYLFGAGLGFVLVMRALGIRPSLRGRGEGHIRRIAGYASAFLIIDGAFTAFSQIDVVLIGAIISVTAVGRFQAPLRLITFLGYTGTATASGVGPRLARDREGPDTETFERALRRLMAIQGIFIAPLIVWAEPITRIALGRDYAQSASVLRGLAPFAFLLAVSPVLARGVNYLGEARLRIPIAVATLLLNLVFDLVFLPKIGIVAGAIGTDLAYSLYVGAHFWICRRMLGTELRPLAMSFGRAMVGVAAMSGVLFAFGTGAGVGIPSLLAGGVLGALAYGGVMVLTGEFTPAELLSARRRVRAALPGRLRRA